MPMCLICQALIGVHNWILIHILAKLSLNVAKNQDNLKESHLSWCPGLRWEGFPAGPLGQKRVIQLLSRLWQEDLVLHARLQRLHLYTLFTSHIKCFTALFIPAQACSSVHKLFKAFIKALPLFMSSRTAVAP